MLDIIYKLSDLDKLASVLIEELPSKIVCFKAPMGAGKTTLIKAILKNSPEEALDFGIEEYLSFQGWIFIEWPELIEELLPENATFVEISILDDQSRQLYIY